MTTVTDAIANVLAGELSEELDAWTNGKQHWFCARCNPGADDIGQSIVTLCGCHTFIKRTPGRAQCAECDDLAAPGFCPTCGGWFE